MTDRILIEGIKHRLNELDLYGGKEAANRLDAIATAWIDLIRKNASTSRHAYIVTTKPFASYDALNVCNHAKKACYMIKHDLVEAATLPGFEHKFEEWTKQDFDQSVSYMKFLIKETFEENKWI